MQAIKRVRADGHVCGTDILPPAAPLAWNDALFSAAARHSLDMATLDYFSHTGLDGSLFSQRIAQAGYSSRGAGENIAAGQNSVAGVMTTWMQSAGHCRNIMNPLYTDVAVACVAKSGNTYGIYWTMDLGVR